MRKGDITVKGGRDGERARKREGRERLRMRAQFQSDSRFARSVWRRRETETREESSQAGLRRQHSVCLRLGVSLWTFEAPAWITKAAAPHATGWRYQTSSIRFSIQENQKTGRWERDALTLVEFKEEITSQCRVPCRAFRSRVVTETFEVMTKRKWEGRREGFKVSSTREEAQGPGRPSTRGRFSESWKRLSSRQGSTKRSGLASQQALVRSETASGCACPIWWGMEPGGRNRWWWEREHRITQRWRGGAGNCLT